VAYVLIIVYSFRRFSICLYGPSKSSTTISVQTSDFPSTIVEDFFNG